MGKKMRRLLSVALSMTLAASTVVSVPFSAEAAGKTIDIDFSQTDGEMIPKTGWLLTPNESLPDGRIIPLNTKDVRDNMDTQNFMMIQTSINNDNMMMEDFLANEQNRNVRQKRAIERLNELGVDNYYPIMGGIPSWIMGAEGPWGSIPDDNYDLWKQWIKDVVQYMKDNDLGVNEYNVYNENWGITDVEFNKMFEEAWWAGKEVMPDSKMIGPSPSSDNAGVVQSLANYCEQAGIPLDIVAWHFGNYNNIPNFQQKLAGYIAQKPTLGDPKYYYEEYTTSGNVGKMNVEFTTLANFDRADIDAAIRGVWTDTNGLSDMVLTNQNAENPYPRQKIWWLMTTYGSMSGTRVKQSGNDLYVASYDKEKGEAKILIGNQSGDVTLNLENLPFEGKNVRVDKYKITDVENDGLQYQSSDPEAVAGSTVSTEVSFANNQDVWMIVVKEEGSIPSDFALMGPDDGMATALQPEFSWQASQGATSYDFVISKNKDMSDPVYSKKGITDTKYTLEQDLKTGETYYWTVTANNAYGKRKPYNGMYYSLLATKDTAIPGPFTMLQVIDGDMGTVLTPKVSWEESRDADKYVISISQNKDFSNSQTVEVTDPKEYDMGYGLTYVYYTLTEAEMLKPATHYYIKVDAVNEHGTRAMNGTVHEFTTTTADGKPTEFKTTTPGNGKTVEPRSTLRWEQSLGAFFYRLEIATDKEFKDVVLQRDTITVPAYTLEEDILKPETTYYWRVTAVTKDGEQETQCSNGVQSFTMSQNPTPPIVKVAYSAPGGAIVSFDGVQEADSYVVKYGTSSGNYTKSVEVTEEMAYIPLDSNGTYYFTVAAVRDGVEGKTYNEVSAQKGSSEPDEIVLDEKIEIEGATNLAKTKLQAGTGMSGSLAVNFNEVGSKAEFSPMVEADKIELTYQADQDTTVGVYINGKKIKDVWLNQTEAGKYDTVTIAVDCKAGDTLVFQKDTKEVSFVLDYMILSNGEKLENLALKKPAAADSVFKPYTADKAVDGSVTGNNNDFWTTKVKPTTDAPNWLTVDFQGEAEIHSIEIALPDIPAWTERTQEIRILTSLDGETYTEQVAKTKYTFTPGNDGNNNKCSIMLKQPVKATQIKVEIYSNDDHAGVGVIGELYVWGIPKDEETSGNENLALKKPTTLNNCFYGNAKTVTDGNNSTFFEGDYENYPTHVTVDLERPYTLTSVEMQLPPKAKWGVRNQEIEVQVSMDGKEFTTIVEQKKYRFDDEHDQLITVNLPEGAKGRYIRVVGYSNDAVFTRPVGFQLSELRVYGSSTPVESVQIDQENTEIPLGATAQLSATVTPDQAEYRDVAWSSSDITIATVDANGVVTAKAKGSCEIRARSLDNPNCMDKITITVSDAVIDKIEVTAPDKIEYLVGEELDLTGFEAKAVYTDGTEKDVTKEVTLSGYDKTKAGEQTVTVSYERKTAEFTVSVKAELTGITLTPPKQLKYEVGDKLNLDGMKVMAQYTDGAEKDVTKEAEVSGYDAAKTGKQTITVSYEGYEETFVVEVVKADEGETKPTDPDTSKPDTSGNDDTSDTPKTGDTALPIMIVAGVLVLSLAGSGVVLWKRKKAMTK